MISMNAQPVENPAVKQEVLSSKSGRLAFIRRLCFPVAGFRNSLYAGIYLYTFNTLPEVLLLRVSEFSRKTGGELWKMQAAIFLFYVLLAGMTIACVSLLDHLLDRRPPIAPARRIALAYVAILSSMAATMLFIVCPWYFHLFGQEWGSPWVMCFASSVMATVVYASVRMHRTAKEKREAWLRMQLETDELNSSLARTELAMLEAQIEPHFLFNTLAHIKRQYRIDTGKANHMLTSLILYLGRAMPALQRADWTLENELDLVKTYLGILAHRFGPRLRFSINAPDDAKRMRLPALIVTTLVENAIRHGLAPKQEGGMVSVVAELHGDMLQIEVQDDGVGFRKSSGSGLGLATIHARLRSAFGGRAELIVAPRSPEGVRASIRIPFPPDRIAQ